MYVFPFAGNFSAKLDVNPYVRDVPWVIILIRFSSYHVPHYSLVNVFRATRT